MEARLLCLALLAPALLSSTAAPQGGACYLEQAHLGQDPAGGIFGFSSALDGDTLVVADEGYQTIGGRALVHVRAAGVWTLEAELTGSGLVPGDRFARSVAVDEDTILVGADAPLAVNGRAYVFVRSGTVWSEQAVLVSDDVQPNDGFGFAVAVEGDRAVVGAIGAEVSGSYPGAAYVFVRSGTTWSQEARLPPVGGTQRGFSVDIDADRVVVGSPSGNTKFPVRGSATVFLRQGTTWTFEDDLDSGVPYNEADVFGSAVALEGDRILVGAPRGDSWVGLAYAFERSGTGWRRIQVLGPGGRELDGLFGSSVGLACGRAVVGAPYVDVAGTDSGAVFVLERVGTTWAAAGELVGSATGNGDGVGYSVDIDGGTIAFTAPWEVLPGSLFGAAYVFAAPPAPVGFCTAGTSASDCAATLSATGWASTGSASGFVVRVDQVEGGKPGTLFFGTSGRKAVPWGNGSSYQCAIGPLTRTGLQPGSGRSGTCEGALVLDFNEWMSAHPLRRPAAGETVQMQGWYRDPASTSNRPTSLSDALEFAVCP